MSRRISFSLKTSTAALTRSSVDDVSSMASSPFHSILVSVPRKSNRVASSLAAWLSALSTSCRSTLLTMSNDESAIRSVPSSGDSRLCLVYPFVVTCLAAGCPSGQWERTVNPSAYAYTGSNPVPATTSQRRCSASPLDSFAQAHNSPGLGQQLG